MQGRTTLDAQARRAVGRSLETAALAVWKDLAKTTVGRTSKTFS